MNRQEKESIIESIKQDFSNNASSFVVTVKGMSVEAVHNLRKDLYPKGGKLKVAKNTLLKIATKDLEGLSPLGDFFQDQIAIVFADKETPAVAKALSQLANESSFLKLKAGSLDKQFISAEQIEALASLPSREVLLAKVCGTLNAPISAYVSVLNQLILRLLYVLQKIEQKKA